MGIGVALFLFAVGAIMRFAIEVNTNGTVDVHMIGVILMIVGGVGALLSMAFWSTWGGWGGNTNGNSDNNVIVERDRPRRTVVVEK
ncbi:MAG: hypothetical protein QOI61_947 [Actinomycetota bacterium]|jgi:hypothetical protein